MSFTTQIKNENSPRLDSTSAPNTATVNFDTSYTYDKDADGIFEIDDVSATLTLHL